MWACRLLGQFLTDSALVISIDESHIRSDQANQHRWQFMGSDRVMTGIMQRPLATQPNA